MRLDELLQPVVVQPDGIEQPGTGFNRSRRRVANARLWRDGFGDDSAERGEIDVGLRLARVSKRPRCDENGIRKLQAVELYGESIHSIIVSPTSASGNGTLLN